MSEKDEPKPGNAAETTTIRQWCERIKAGLTPHEQRLLHARLGIHLTGTNDLEELGRQYEETRRRIEKIEEKALRQMRKPPR